MKKSFAILNSSLLLALILYLVNVLIRTLADRNMPLIAVMLAVPLKVYISGGIYGMLVELVSGEEMTLRLSRFHVNAKKYLRPFLFLTGIPFLFYLFVIKNGFLLKGMDIFKFFAFVNPLILFILAFHIIQDKYVIPQKLEKKRNPIRFSAMITLLLLFAASLFIFHIPSLSRLLHFDLYRITSFVYIAMTFLIFIYYANLILEQYPEITSRFDSEKEIYLVSPPGGGMGFHLSSLALRQCIPPFIVLKALTPKTYKFREFNKVPWKSHYCKPGKLVAITCFTSNAMDSYAIAREFKKQGSKVVMGGPHVTYFPEEALEYCDSVVCGEAENVWPQVIKDYENGCLQPKYIGTPAKNCHKLVHQELLHSPPEIIKDFLETSRGCKFNCSFCAVPALSRKTLRKQDVADFIELIKKIKKTYPTVGFIDNNIYSDPAYTRELFEALKPQKIKWLTQCSIDIAKNKELLRLAKESGCQQFLIGFEISEGSFEKNQGGKLALADHYKDYAKKIKKLGIKIKAHYIFGFESHTFKHLLKLWKFCFSINPSMTCLSILTPFPGTQFYYETLKKDRILNLNWSHYGAQTLVLRHPRMNNDILRRLYLLIPGFFLLTTSKVGYFLLFLMAVILAAVI